MSFPGKGKAPGPRSVPGGLCTIVTLILEGCICIVKKKKKKGISKLIIELFLVNSPRELQPPPHGDADHLEGLQITETRAKRRCYGIKTESCFVSQSSREEEHGWQETHRICPRELDNTASTSK